MSGRHIEFYTESPAEAGTPIVILNAFGDEGGKCWNELKQLTDCPCLLAAVSIDQWEDTLSPWPTKKVFSGGKDFGSGADAYLDELCGEIIPVIRQRSGISEGPCCLAGYSFAGLFALYSMYRTDAFERIAAVSSSLWFPGFTEFAMRNALKRVPDRLYMSLGDKESSTKNEVMRTVGEKTALLADHYRGKGISCVYEMNPGNHFHQPEKRLAKGISRILRQALPFGK